MWKTWTPSNITKTNSNKPNHQCEAASYSTSSHSCSRWSLAIWYHIAVSVGGQWSAEKISSLEHVLLKITIVVLAEKKIRGGNNILGGIRKGFAFWLESIVLETCLFWNPMNMFWFLVSKVETCIFSWKFSAVFGFLKGVLSRENNFSENYIFVVCVLLWAACCCCYCCWSFVL